MTVGEFCFHRFCEPRAVCFRVFTLPSLRQGCSDRLPGLLRLRCSGQPGEWAYQGTWGSGEESASVPAASSKREDDADLMFFRESSGSVAHAVVTVVTAIFLCLLPTSPNLGTEILAFSNPIVNFRDWQYGGVVVSGLVDL